MSQIYNVKEGATLSCSLGSCTSKLQVPKGHGASIQGKNEACIMDNQVGVNIMPFGTCAKTNPPVSCTPTIVLPWLLGKKDFVVGDELALLNTCIISCMGGGIIKIEDCGQK